MSPTSTPEGESSSRRGILTQTRPLGRTGFHATRLGIGDLADRSMEIDRCVAIARRAIDAGLNLIDTAPGYESGYSEQIVGRAVRGCRDRMFVIDKIDYFDQPVVAQVEGSLQRLELEHTDLFVFHGLSSLDGWKRMLDPGGAMQQLQRCVEQGKTRFRGISSHHPDVVIAAIESGLCDVVMFPVGPFVDERYITEALPRARKRGVGTVCFKTFGAGKLVADTTGYNRPIHRAAFEARKAAGGAESATMLPRLTVNECVHYTLTCDPDVALLGLSVPAEQDEAFAAAKAFKPLSDEAMADIASRAIEAVEGKGECGWNPQK